MKHFLFTSLLLMVVLSLHAQTDSTEAKKPIYSVRHGFVSGENMKSSSLNEFSQYHLYQSGIAIRKSTNFQYISLGTAVFSGSFWGVAGCVKNSGGKKALRSLGGIMAGVSLATLITSIHFHDKAGRELQLSAGEVVYKF